MTELDMKGHVRPMVGVRRYEGRSAGSLGSNIVKGAAVFVVILWLFPVYWVFLTSIKPSLEIDNPVPSFVFRPTLESYVDIFTKFDFGPALTTSIVVAVASSFIVIILATMAAYSLARMHVPGEKHIALAILSVRFIPAIAVVIPIYLELMRLNLLDTYIGLIIVYTSFNLPFAIWVLRSFLFDVPFEIEEAALLDGLSRIQLMSRIVVPIVLPGIAVTVIFCFIFTWNEYLVALLLTSVERTTAPVAIAKFLLPLQVLWGDLAAATIIQLLPILCVVFVLQRHIVRGLALGAVK